MLRGKSMSIKLKPLNIASVLALSVTLSLSSMGVAAAAPLPSGISAPFAVSAATKKITTYRTTVNVNLRKGAGTKHQRIATIKKAPSSPRRARPAANGGRSGPANTPDGSVPAT
ncbi:hypothetical protein GCM10009628_15630 [Paeniglutamicibacter kerguelensis]